MLQSCVTPIVEADANMEGTIVKTQRKLLTRKDFSPEPEETDEVKKKKRMAITKALH